MTGPDVERRPIHNAALPGWDCAVCGRPWPCAEAKLELLAEYGASTFGLHSYMCARAVDAMRDLRTLPAGDVYDRFLAWIGTRGSDILGAP